MDLVGSILEISLSCLQLEKLIAVTSSGLAGGRLTSQINTLVYQRFTGLPCWFLQLGADDNALVINQVRITGY